MNEASRIVHELQCKLAELDRRVWLYRREMASEFEKYTDNLLKNVSSDVSKTVIHTMTQSKKNYQSIFSDNDTVFDSAAPEERASQEKSIKTLSESLRRFDKGSYKEPDSQSPDLREMGLHGVFTPNYLPLLDHSSCERQSNSQGLSRKHYTDKGSGCAKDCSQVDASTEVTGLLMPSSGRNASTNSRTYIEGTSHTSKNSESSCGTIRRSALRGSSSSSKLESQSPRRVRFDVAGEEVLPTSSPISAALISLEKSSMTTFDSDDDHSDSGDNQDLRESNPPKRISSSQALRMLSRRSLVDDGTVWTAVCSLSDESAPSISGINTIDLPTEHRRENYKIEHSSPVALSLNQINLRMPISVKDTSTDEDLPYPLPQLINERVTPFTPLPRSNKQSFDFRDIQSSILNELRCSQKEEEFQEDIFEFDDPSLIPEQRHMVMHQNDEEEESQAEDEEDFLTIKANRSKSYPISSSSYSKASTLHISPESSLATPETSESLDFENCSNKDHPFSIPIVRSDIHARAAGLGSLNTFVGSLDGRTGLDESNTDNLCSSIGSPKRTVVESLRAGRAPQSLAERMLLEDLVEEDLSRIGNSHYADTY